MRGIEIHAAARVLGCAALLWLSCCHAGKGQEAPALVSDRPGAVVETFEDARGSRRGPLRLGVGSTVSGAIGEFSVEPLEDHEFNQRPRAGVVEITDTAHAGGAPPEVHVESVNLRLPLDRVVRAFEMALDPGTGLFNLEVNGERLVCSGGIGQPGAPEVRLDCHDDVLVTFVRDPADPRRGVLRGRGFVRSLSVGGEHLHLDDIKLWDDTGEPVLSRLRPSKLAAEGRPFHVPFAGTRGIDASTSSDRDRHARSMSLDGLDLSRARRATVTGRVYGPDGRSLAAGTKVVSGRNAPVTVEIPLDLHLEAGRTYRFSFHVETEPPDQAYVEVATRTQGRFLEDEAVFSVRHDYRVSGDRFPTEHLGQYPDLALRTTPWVEHWTWVVGRLEEPHRQSEYEALAREIFELHQQAGRYPGVLVREDDLEEEPGDYAIFLGPLDAFRRPERLRHPLEQLTPFVTDAMLTEPRTGIRLRDRRGKHLLLTGLSLDGVRDVADPSLGVRACTVTVGGHARFGGNYGPDGLRMGALPFGSRMPSARSLASRRPLMGTIAPEAVLDEEQLLLAPPFAERLGAHVEEARVLMVSTSPWNRDVERLSDLILVTLMDAREVRAVVFDLDFSLSAHLDRYVSLEKDEAARFLADELHAFVPFQSTLDTLDLIRAWNRAHPNRPVRVACVGRERHPTRALDRIVVPYLRFLDRDYRLSRLMLRSQPGRAEELRRMRAILEAGTTEDHPFLTRSFVAGVLTNLEGALADEDEPASTVFQRNLVAHGQLAFDAGLSLFKETYLGTGPEISETARFLDEVHPPTRGRVASVLLSGVGYGFENAARRDSTTSMRATDDYHGWVDRYRAAVEYGGVTEGHRYRLPDRPMDIVEDLAVLWGERSGLNELALRVVDPDLLAEAGGSPFAETDHDEVVFVLRSDLERPRTTSSGVE